MQDDPRIPPEAEDGAEPRPLEAEADGVVEGEAVVDPNGPPLPAPRSPAGSALRTGCFVLAGGAVAALILPVFCSGTMGATRSSRLQWQERERQVEEAFQREHAPRPETGDSPTMDRP